MPLTPFHLGPGLFFAMLWRRFFNIFAFLLGSVVMDFEPLILIFVRQCYYCPHHDFFHTILGAIVGSLILTFLLWVFRKELNKLSLKFKISQNFSFKVLFLSSLSAWLLHIFLDSLVHNDVFPFWPSLYNPILIGRQLLWPLHLILFILGILGLILFYKYYVKYKFHSSASRES